MTDRTQPDSASTTGSTHIIRYALELGLLWVDGDGRDKVREALDALDTLEAQLEASGFTAADMATASAQGFRDGVASLGAAEPAIPALQPVAWLVTGNYIRQAFPMHSSAEAYLRGLLSSDPDGGYKIDPLVIPSQTATGASLAASAGEPMAWLVCTEEGDPDMVFLDQLEACQYCEDDDPPKPLYLASPPTAQAGGWQSIETAPNEGVFLVFMQDEVRPARRMQVANWHTNVKIVGGLFAFDCAKVTHWMPLPPSPTSAEGVEHG